MSDRTNGTKYGLTIDEQQGCNNFRAEFTPNPIVEPYVSDFGDTPFPSHPDEVIKRGELRIYGYYELEYQI